MDKNKFFMSLMIVVVLFGACGEHYMDYSCNEDEMVCRGKTQYKCVNGKWNDGENCTLGCSLDGLRCLVEGCDQHDQTGACICVHGNKADGSCDDGYCVDGTFNPKDGSCKRRAKISPTF